MSRKGKPHPRELLSQKDAAARLDVSPRQMRRLGKHGIPREKSGLYPWPQINDWYIGFKQSEAISRQTGGAIQTADPEKESKAANYFEARARKESALADLREMEVNERRGDLVHVDDLEALLTAPLTSIRTQLLALPGLVAPKLADRELAVGEVVALLSDEIDRLLNDQADAGIPLPEFGSDG